MGCRNAATERRSERIHLLLLLIDLLFASLIVFRDGFVTVRLEHGC